MTLKIEKPLGHKGWAILINAWKLHMRQQIVYVEAARRAAVPKKQNTTIHFWFINLYKKLVFKVARHLIGTFIECTFVNMKKNLAVQDQIVKHMFQKSHGKNNFSLG